MTFKRFYTPGLKPEKPRVNGVEQLTEDSVCCQCVLSLTDCELLSDNVLEQELG